MRLWGIRATNWRHWSSLAGVLGLVSVVFAIAARSQQQAPMETVEEIIKRVKKGQFYPADAYRLAQANATDAIPALKERFVPTKDSLLKAALASALVRLGTKEDIYWEFLKDRVTAAVENDPPSIFLTDSKGKLVRGQGKFSPQFTAWAKSKNLDPNIAAQAQIYEFPNYVTLMGLTGDTRGRELLRRAMSSHNYLVQTAAAKGLAKLKDNNSVPIIVQACEHSPTEIAPMIARALVFFDDPRAQSAADKFISNKALLQQLRKRATQKGADPFLN